MNRFVLDYDPETAAAYHCDKHVVKMILEEAQMLSTVHRLHGYEGDELYRATHKGHPCTVWAGETTANYDWAYSLMLALLDEYTLRYNKIHATDRLALPLMYPPISVPVGDLTPFPQAMPDDVKADDAVHAYRDYYMLHKRGIATWKFTDTPKWWV